jgi:16S rRNA (cytidine1402-2'-O)-methyltransferase
MSKNKDTAVQTGLWLVATPIGNLGDITPRAVEVLQAASLICCEDTRRSGQLLKLLGINLVDNDARLLVTNEHTEYNVITQVMESLAHGKVVAVITDAGTPGISDPGSLLVRAAIDNDYPVLSAPGPAAFVSAVIVSGLPTDRIAFEGFLPRTGQDRSHLLAELSREMRTVVLYEAPHRLSRTVADLAKVCGDDRQVVLCRELTKMHEEVWRGTFAEAQKFVEEREPRGEYVIVVAPFTPEENSVTDEEIALALVERLNVGDSKKKAVEHVVTMFSVARNRVYDISINLPSA